MMINIIISRSSKTLFCLEFKSSSKGTNISELQNIKFKRDNYNIHSNTEEEYEYIL